MSEKRITIPAMPKPGEVQIISDPAVIEALGLSSGYGDLVRIGKGSANSPRSKNFMLKPEVQVALFEALAKQPAVKAALKGEKPKPVTSGTRRAQGPGRATQGRAAAATENVA